MQIALVFSLQTGMFFSEGDKIYVFTHWIFESPFTAQLLWHGSFLWQLCEHNSMGQVHKSGLRGGLLTLLMG